MAGEMPKIVRKKSNSGIYHVIVRVARREVRFYLPELPCEV